MSRIVARPDRAVLEIAGADRVAFLQGLVSNDVTRAAPSLTAPSLTASAQTVWSAFLTPQGKYLAEFFVFGDGATLLLEGDAAAMTALAPRLARYRLRAAATLRARPDLHVFLALDGAPSAPQDAICAADPRLPEAGWRILSPTPLPAEADASDWHLHRIRLGLPEHTDLEPEKTVLLEAGFDELGGISWSKGCYLGQELTARTKYRGLVKRRLVPVTLTADMPPGTPILCDGAEAGSLRAVVGRDALALLRLDCLDKSLFCGEAAVRPSPPPWLRLPSVAA